MKRHQILRVALGLLSCVMALGARAQERIALSDGKATLECYTVSDGGGVGVVVCPGGSYSWLDYETEGVGVARWLNSNGISAYVLRYRVQGWWAWATHYRLIFRGNRYPDALNDAEAALDYLEKNADSLGLDPKRIGIMGFSAGGHLAMLSTYSRRPRFVAAIYPVVSMSDASVHKRSRRALLGEYGQYNKELRDSLSLERHVRRDCPPVFLVNCVDDPIVDYRNSVLLDSALTANDVPHLYLQYTTGGHGFGATSTKGSEECQQWKEEFIRWINRLWE